MATATVSVVVEINKTVRMLSNCADLDWRCFNLADKLEDVVIGVSSDAAGGNRPDLGSPGGWLAWMANSKIYTGERTAIVLLNFSSKRLARVARSTFSAET